MNKKAELAGFFLIFVFLIIMFDVSLPQQLDKSAAILYKDFERSVPEALIYSCSIDVQIGWELIKSQ